MNKSSKLSAMIVTSIVLFLCVITSTISTGLENSSVLFRASAEDVTVEKPVITSCTSTYSSVKLKWNKIAGVSGYRIYRYNSETDEYEKIAVLNGETKRSYTDTELDPSSAYKYRIKAYITQNGKTTYSKKSSAVTVQTKDVVVPQSVINTDYTSKASSVTIGWQKLEGVTGYRIYKLDRDTGKYAALLSIKDPETLTYTDAQLEESQKYSYKIRAYIKYKDKYYYGKYSSVLNTCTIAASAPAFESVELVENNAIFRWNAVNCDGYRIYIYLPYENEWKKIRDVPADVTSCEKSLDSYGGFGLFAVKFRIAAYTKDDSDVKKRTKYSYSEEFYDIDSICDYYSTGVSRLKKATLEPRDSYILYNNQGSKATKTTCYITQGDKDAIMRFSEKYFGEDWTPEQKVAFTLNWINKNVEYAAGAKYSEIAAMGYAEAIFDHKLGQCVQYNGALIEMMNILGFKASLIMSHRGTENYKWQHFWGEIKIGSKKYVLETGNYGKSGNWSYCCSKYSETSMYLKNGKAVK